MTEEMQQYISTIGDYIRDTVGFDAVQKLADKDQNILECVRGGDYIEYGQPIPIPVKTKRKVHAIVWTIYRACQFMSAIMECAYKAEADDEMWAETVYDLLGLLLGNADFRAACARYTDKLPPEAEDFARAGLKAVEGRWR